MSKYDLNRIDLNLLKVVSAVADTGSVSDAASRLSVTQPAISNALTRLRQLTGDKIFVREGGKQQPTRFGRELVLTSRTVLTQVENCFYIQQIFDPLITLRSFRLSIIDNIQMVLLPKILAHFQQFDTINLEILPCTQESAIRDVERGETDIMLGVGPYDTSKISVDTVYEDKLSVIVRNGHPIVGRKKKLAVKDFEQLEFVIQSPGLIKPQSPELMFRRLGICRRIAYEVPYPMSIPAIVMATDYAGVILHRMYQPIAERYDLAVFPLPFKYPGLLLFLGYATVDREDLGITWLKEELKKILTQ